MKIRSVPLAGVAAALALGLAAPSFAQRSFEDVSKGFTEVPTAPGESGLFRLWKEPAKNQLIAEFPRGWEKKKFLVAATPSQGNIFAGLQGPAIYCYWKKYDDRLALVAPQLAVRSSGEASSRQSVERIFTDRVLLDVPILTNGPAGQPVIDMDALLVQNAPAIGGARLNARLAEITSAKAFPKNIEIEIKAPDNAGTYRAMHYSISEVPTKSSYRPREADDRVGYFTTTYRDLGMYGTETNWKRYINRWQLEKRDPSLKLSPPKEPIVFYVEHTVPVRYRRYVREGILWWNEAFRAIGLDNAVEVYQQDEVTGAHMDKDPEDVRYNFVRWLNNDIATAIGPSRAHPLTGQILDADIVLTDGWIRAFFGWFEEKPGELAMSLDADALVWLEDHPEWDPRLRLLPLEQRTQALAERERRAAAGDLDPADSRKGMLAMLEPELREAIASSHADCALCMAARGKAADMAFAGMHLDVLGLISLDGIGDDDDELLDGVPEWFVGPHLRELVAHEVGHTLGLRHNFKASSIYTLDEINSDEVKGKKPLASSVMDYLPTNFNVDPDSIQGDFSMIGVGPYDMWAIEYGYTFDDPKKVLERVGEHVYLTDEDTAGPDPLARRYDFSKNPLDYAKAQMTLVNELRGRLLEEYVKDGDSWERARKGYLVTIRKQRQMVDMMANWIGGTHVARVRKGDANTGDPLTPVDPAMQREALQFVVKTAFPDEAYGLTPELLSKLTVEQWGGASDMRGSPNWPIHDQIGGIQSLAITLVMNPSRLGQVFDNELRMPAGDDAVTLPEIFEVMTSEIYRELDGAGKGGYTDRKPMVSSLRRNLQAGMTDRLIAMSTGDARVSLPIRQLSQMHLRELDEKLEKALKRSNSLDTYTRAHLEDMKIRTDRALSAMVIAQ